MPQPRLPDFLIVGGMRCGTTDARRRLRKHPSIFMAAAPSRRPRRSGHTTGETHFFDDPERWRKGLDWYKKLFAEAGSLVAGEQTPSYVSSAEAMRRIARQMPKVKIVVLLRNPVTRLWSEFRFHNRMWWRNGQTSTFSQFLAGGGGKEAVARGNYGRHVARLLELFPRPQIHVEYTEISADDPQAATRRTQVFLGVKPVDCGPSVRVQLGPAAYKEDYRPMPVKQAERFRRYYREQNKKLYELLGSEHIKTWF